LKEEDYVCCVVCTLADTSKTQFNAVNL